MLRKCWLYHFLDEAAEEEYEIIIDDEEYTVYVIDSDENEEYTFDDETPFDVYTVDVSCYHTNCMNSLSKTV